MNTAQHETLAFIGVGVMGEGMCRNLAKKAGQPVMAYDLHPENLLRLADDGVVAASLESIRAEATTVFLSLPSIDQVEDVCLGANGLARKGARIHTIVDMSTSDVRRTRELAARLAPLGVTLVDAPVARSREAANNGTLLITVGATQEVFDSVQPWLRCMGSDVVRCGDVGAGQVVKIMNNMVLLSTVHSLAEAMAIAEAAGVEKTMLAQVLKLGSADSFALRLVGEKSLAQDHFPEKQFPTSYALKDMRLALELANAQGIEATAAQSTAAILQAAATAGYGSHYYPVIYRLIRPSPH